MQSCIEISCQVHHAVLKLFKGKRHESFKAAPIGLSEVSDLAILLVLLLINWALLKLAAAQCFNYVTGIEQDGSFVRDLSRTSAGRLVSNL